MSIRLYQVNDSRDRFLKKGFSIMTVLAILFVIGIVIGVRFIMSSSTSNADMSKISKISNAINFYYGKNGAIPGSGSSSMTSQGIYDALRSDKMVIPEDFVLESFKTNLTFVGCNDVMDKDGREFWEWAPLSLNSKICVTTSSSKITDDPEAPSYVGAAGAIIPSLMNSYLICQIETSIDDKNMTKGSGRLVKNGIKNAKIESTQDFKCSQYAKEKLRPIESESSSYAYKVY